jgi:glycosyltransferase involved in cell wall biosynthesis
MTALAACTIVSKNYVAYARVLARSFREHHPQGRFFVLLVDRNEGKIDPAAEPFELVEIETLRNVPRLDAFLFKYTLLEANTAVKPFFLEYLIETYQLENLVYFDPDILILSSLDRLAELVAGTSIVLTPHLTEPIADDAYPNEQAILMSGSFNLGFIALRMTEASRALLRWWQERLYDKCLVRIPEALFVDQKWMDLAPGLFKEVLVLHDPGYNVAYWNLHGRTVTIEADGPQSNGRPLVFFHFSGIDPQSLEGVSKHQNRFRLGDIGGAADLYRRYAALVLAEGHLASKPWPYAFGRFSNGVVVPDVARSLYHGLGEAKQKSFGNPFEVEGEGSFFRWLNAPQSGGAPAEPYLSRLLHHFYGQRPDLQAAYPDPTGEHFAGFSAWLLEAGRFELKLDPIWLDAVQKPSARDLLEGGAGRRLVHRLKRLYHSPLGQKLKKMAREALGPVRTKALKQRLRPTQAAAPNAPAVVAAPGTPTIARFGVNVIGYLKAETGMGECGRMLALALEQAGIPTSRHHLELGVIARQEDARAGASSDDFPYDVNLLVVNADQVAAVAAHLGPNVMAGRCNIGYWLWELEEFPDALRGAFGHLHEIWTPTTFCMEAFAAKSPIPVRCLPFPVQAPESALDIRRELGLPADAFLALYLFNYLSYFERKNPIAAVHAFQAAFGDDASRVLVLKTSQKDFAPEEHAKLISAIGAAANIQLIDDYLSRDQVSALLLSCDAYLSLHRSEGFGLTLAEAMAAGKPVIATTYSAPRDFFDLNNGLPVRYDLVELKEDQGPYLRGTHWADPDVAHAAEQLRRAAAEGLDALRHRARTDIESRYGLAPCGRRLARQLDDLAIRYGKALRPPH